MTLKSKDGFRDKRFGPDGEPTEWWVEHLGKCGDCVRHYDPATGKIRKQFVPHPTQKEVVDWFKGADHHAGCPAQHGLGCTCRRTEILAKLDPTLAP